MVSVLQAAESWFIILLGSAPWWVRLVLGLVQAFWWDGLVPAHWWVELGLVPLVSRAMSRGMFRGGCELRTTLGSLSADGWGFFLPCWLFGLRCPSTGACRLLSGARSQCHNGDLWERSH